MTMSFKDLELLATIYCCLDKGMKVTEEELDEFEKLICKFNDALEKRNARARSYANKNRDVYNLYSLRAKAKKQGNDTKVEELDEQIRFTRLGI